MSNQNMEISEIIKKCKILLLDIEGTTTSISFVKDKLFPYVEENVKQFLESEWDKDNVKEAVSALRKQALEDQEKNVDGAVTISGEDASKEDQIETLVKNMKWQMSIDRKTGALKHMQGLIWKQGYDNGDIKGHVFDDVSPALEQWHSVEDQKVYIYSSGSVQAQKLLFGQTLVGDLLKFIDGHFDTAVGPKQETASYTNIAEKIGSKPEEILFLTDIPKEAEVARAAGLHVALMSREGNFPLSSEDTSSFPVLHSLAQLTVTNKRKTETQDELPAKVPKTDTDDDVKSNNTHVEIADESSTTQSDEKMDVEEETATAEKPKTENDDIKEELPVQIETKVEEVTDQDVNVPVLEINPIVTEVKNEESTVKTERNEAMDVDAGSNEINENPSAVVTEDKATVAEETPPIATVVTEIEEVTNDKQTLEDVSEIIDDLEPVVEEPPAVEDIDELKNVGEVLEKECDEILSKVQDVTNLDNLPIKPLLNPIAEETMETENAESNDIGDRILDTELDLEMKPCVDIDLNAVTEIDGNEKIKESVKANECKPKDTEETVSETVEQKVPSETEKVTEETGIETGTVADTGKETVKEIAKETVKEISKETPKEIAKEIVTEANKEAATGIVTETVKGTVTEMVKDRDTNTEPIKETSVKPTDVNNTKDELTDISSPVEELKNDKIAQPELDIKETNVSAETVESTTEAETVTNSKESDITEASKLENKIEETVSEVQVNGKTTNGDIKTSNVNGDASKDEELSSRLSVENGNSVENSKEVNGSSGETPAEQGQGDNKKETDVAADIKVKTVITEESHTDPIEQPTEA